MGDFLAQAADWFKVRKCRIDAWFEDDRGRYAFAVTVDGQRFVVVAKKYPHNGNASFMERKVVDRAIDRGALLLELIAEQDTLYVFHPKAVKQYGTKATPDDGSKRAEDGEDWLDVHMSMGVNFERWVDGLEDPKRHPDPSDPVERVADNGDDETPARPHDITEWATDG